MITHEMEAPMRRIKISVLSMVLVLWVALPLWWSPSTQAQGTLNSRLDGTYSFHLFRNCNRETTGSGFNATTFVLNAGGGRMDVLYKFRELSSSMEVGTPVSPKPLL